MPSRYQEMLRTQRQNENTARAGLAWESGEEDKVLDMIFTGKSYDDVAKELQRTEGSIRTRLCTILCKQIDAGDETVESVFDKYKVSSQELDEFREKKKKREENIQQRLKNRKAGKKPAYSNAPSYDTNTNSLVGHIMDIKRDLYTIKQHFKIN